MSKNRLAEGLAFEDRIFGHHSGGRNSVSVFLGEHYNFNRDVSLFIKERVNFPKYPNTKIGKSIFDLVSFSLLRFGIDPNGLFFFDCIDTKLDIIHFIDGMIYVPSVPNFPITIDTFHIEDKDLILLKESWIRSSKNDSYSERNFQNDLFAYKTGKKIFIYNKLNKPGFDVSSHTYDFRKFATKSRPENHFILTPYYADNRKRRKVFAEMVARYLATVSKKGPKEA